MIEFKDWDGDTVRAQADDLSPQCYCVSFADGVSFAVLDAGMCRTLAAALLEFADTVESGTTRTSPSVPRRRRRSGAS